MDCILSRVAIYFLYFVNTIYISERGIIIEIIYPLKLNALQYNITTDYDLSNDVQLLIFFLHYKN